jgi:hypothetical protein
MIELANEAVNEAVNEVVNEKPVTQAERIRQFVTEHPFTKATTIAKKMGVDRQYVYTVMWNMKNKTKLAKKAKGLGKPMTLKEIKAATKRVQDKFFPEPNWKTIEFGSSDIPFYEDSVTDTHTQRLVELNGAIADNIKRNQAIQAEMFEPEFDDLVNHPAHYKVGGIETIDFIEAKKLNYNIGNVVKYLTRADHKGNRKQDLEKAKWYLERELSTMS